MKEVFSDEMNDNGEDSLDQPDEWHVKECEHSDVIENILTFLLQEYKRIFGRETMTKEECWIYNEPFAGPPMLLKNDLPYCIIRITQTDMSTSECYKYIIYELSHELCHYAIRQHKTDKMSDIKWFEEIVCEAMSLYALDYSIDNWHLCPKHGHEDTYPTQMRKYRYYLLLEKATDELRNCRTIQELRDLEPFIETRRETHCNERNILYDEIKKDPLKCKYLCDYQNYILPGTDVAIDFDRWERDVNEPIIKCVHSFQRIDIF